MEKLELMVLMPYLKSFLPFIRAIIILIASLWIAKIVSKKIFLIIPKNIDNQSIGILQRVTYYILLVIGILLGLKQLGFDLGVLIGAAGIMSVAIGFAAQTSTANMISGIFLLFEKQFGVTDIIEVGTTKGEVVSIGLLSTQLRTMDNLSVRIPNEMLMKSEIKNYTRFPLRRIDLMLRVNTDENLEEVKKILFEISDKNPQCLDEPKSVFVLSNLSDSGIEFQFSVWVKREGYLEIKNRLQVEIYKIFSLKNIKIPYPNRVLFKDNG